MIPPRVVLAAVDLSEGSRVGLVLAARLARHCGAALHVVYAEEPLLNAAARQAGIDLARETREELHRFINAAEPAASGSPQIHVAAGSAVDVVLDVAGQSQADVIVAGSRGMSGARKLFFGSTTEGLLRRATVPVLVAPAGWSAPDPGRHDLAGVGPVIAGIDFSNQSVRAAAAACSLAEALNTGVELVHVVPELTVLGRWQTHAASAVAGRVAAAHQELETLARTLVCPRPSVVRVATGAVPEQLADMARPGHGRSPIQVLGKKAPGSAGIAPGAIAYRVLSLASVPVLMYVEP
jgi:nucleotide-binding universal stress UspA family protein